MLTPRLLDKGTRRGPPGEERTVAILLGSVVGAVIGNQIGGGVDEQDRTSLGRVDRNGTTCREYPLRTRDTPIQPKA